MDFCNITMTLNEDFLYCLAWRNGSGRSHDITTPLTPTMIHKKYWTWAKCFKSVSPTLASLKCMKAVQHFVSRYYTSMLSCQAVKLFSLTWGLHQNVFSSKGGDPSDTLYYTSDASYNIVLCMCYFSIYLFFRIQNLSHPWILMGWVALTVRFFLFRRCNQKSIQKCSITLKIYSNGSEGRITQVQSPIFPTFTIHLPVTCGLHQKTLHHKYMWTNDCLDIYCH